MTIGARNRQTRMTATVNDIPTSEQKCTCGTRDEWHKPGCPAPGWHGTRLAPLTTLKDVAP